MSTPPERTPLLEGPGATLLLVALALLVVNLLALAWLWSQPLAPLDQLPDSQPVSITDPTTSD